MTSIIESKLRTVILATDQYSIPSTGYARDDTYIFCDDCRLGLLSANPTKKEGCLRTKNLQIHCARFTVSSDGAAIWTSGDDGDALSRIDGADASNVTITASEWNVTLPPSVDLDKPAKFNSQMPLRILARGGSGANGLDKSHLTAVPGGNGGKAGNGGQVKILANTALDCALVDLGEFTTDLDAVITDFATLRSWASFVKQKFQKVKSLALTIDSLQALLGEAPKEIDVANELSIRKLVQKIASQLSNRSETFMSRVGADTGPGTYGRGGKGAPGQVAGNNGHPGTSGSYTRSILVNDIFLDSDFIIMHPDQVAMAVRRIENLYYVGEIEKTSAAVSSLLARLDWLDSVKEDSPICATYRKDERSLFIVPSDSSNEFPHSINSLKSSKEKLIAYSTQLITSDFYGHSPTWVPRGGPTFYADTYANIKKDSQNLGPIFTKFQTLAREHVMTESERVSARVAASSSITRARGDIEELKERMKVSEEKIRKYHKALATDVTAINREMEKARYEVSGTWNFNMKNFVSAASQFVFAPGAAMGVVQLVGLLETAHRTVQDTSGLEVDKTYVIDQLKVMKSSIKDIDNTITTGSDSATISLNDPNGTKVLGDQKDIEEWTSKYVDAIGETTAKKLKEAVQTFVTRTQQRNSEILQYNTYISLWKQALATIQSSQKIVDTTTEELALMDGMIPAFAVAVEHAYYNVTATLMKLLYKMNRAITFFTLDTNTDHLSALRELGFPSPVEKDPVQAAMDSAYSDLSVALTNAIENHAANVSQAYGANHSMKYHLAPEFIDSLKVLHEEAGKYQIQVTIPPAYKETRQDENPFYSYFDVRISKVRFYIKGVKLPQGENVENLSILMTHGGTSTVVDGGNLEHVFEHGKIHLEFRYNAASKKKEVLMDGDVLEKIAGPNGVQELAFPSPFAEWTLTISSIYHDGSLDLSEVTDAWFEFEGRARAFSDDYDSD
ncbi:unnamed protein product [Periconia digitata]|uniref:Uncharacterized protein n=1 Tax=Periconia digitata TaxID=1303443 RepID=A0A9W4UC83_9PLEO|nr:unnamed protein product [Periconia digitata]